MFSPKRRFLNLSLAGKLTAIGGATGAAALVMAGAILLTFELLTQYRDHITDLSMAADMLGINSTICPRRDCCEKLRRMCVSACLLPTH